MSLTLVVSVGLGVGGTLAFGGSSGGYPFVALLFTMLLMLFSFPLFYGVFFLLFGRNKERAE